MERDIRRQPAVADAEEGHADYTGAVYGSLLAASVVAGTSPRGPAASPSELVVLLLATGIVFWLAHVYSRLAGERLHHGMLTRHDVRIVAGHEWPLVQSAVPPAAMAALGGVVGLSDSATAWAALGVAVVGLVGWAVVATARPGVPRRMVVLSAAVNLVLGLLIVALKAGVAH